MKRCIGTFAALSLIAGMASPVFAGGGKEAAQTAPQKLVLAIWGGDNDKAAMEALIEASRPAIGDVKIELLLLADYDKTITTRLVGGEQIDIMAVAESVHQFSSRNQMLPLNDFISSEKVDMTERFGANKDLYARNGKVYALPLRGGPMVLYCNMDALAEKPKVDWTFEQFAGAAKKAYRPGKTAADTVWGFVPSGNGTWWPWYTSFIYAAGGSLLDGQGKPNFDDPKTVQGLANYVSFIHGSKVAPSLADMADLGQSSPDPVFNSGKAAMIATGWWNVGSLQGADFKWDIAPIPNGAGRGTVIFGQGLGVTAVSKYPKEAFRVVKALTDVAAQETMAKLKWDIPANLKVLNSEAFLNAKWSASGLDMKAVADAIGKGAISLPYNPEWNQMHDIIGNVVNELLAGNVEVDAAAKRIQDELTTLVF